MSQAPVTNDLAAIEKHLFRVWTLLADIRDGNVRPKSETVSSAVAPTFEAIEAVRRVRSSMTDGVTGRVGETFPPKDADASQTSALKNGEKP